MPILKVNLKVNRAVLLRLPGLFNLDLSFFVKKLMINILAIESIGAEDVEEDNGVIL